MLALGAVLSTSQGQDLIKLGFFYAEVKNALWTIGGNKNPRLDGFSSQFFKILDTYMVMR